MSWAELYLAGFVAAVLAVWPVRSEFRGPRWVRWAALVLAVVVWPVGFTLLGLLVVDRWRR